MLRIYGCDHNSTWRLESCVVYATRSCLSHFRGYCRCITICDCGRELCEKADSRIFTKTSVSSIAGSTLHFFVLTRCTCRRHRAAEMGCTMPASPRWSTSAERNAALRWIIYQSLWPAARLVDIQPDWTHAKYHRQSDPDFSALTMDQVIIAGAYVIRHTQGANISSPFSLSAHHRVPSDHKSVAFSTCPQWRVARKKSRAVPGGHLLR